MLPGVGSDSNRGFVIGIPAKNLQFFCGELVPSLDNTAKAVRRQGIMQRKLYPNTVALRGELMVQPSY